MTPILEVTALQAHAVGVPLLRGVDLTLDAGEVVAVVGSSGAGKSTLGLAVLGESARGVELAGSVRVAGTELVDGVTPAARRAARAGRVGHLPQHPGAVLDPIRRCGRVLDELARLVHPRDRAARAAAVAAALDRVRLDPALAARHPHQLSGGQAQRMALAQTVVTSPAVVVLDEPTTGLDDGTAAQLVARLADLAAGGTALLLLTHDRGVARSLAHTVVQLDDGRVARRGDPATILGAEATAPRAASAATGATRLAVERLVVRTRQGSTLLDGVSLTARAGEWVAVHGQSGAGKTTLARAVAGLVARDGGEVAVDGTPLAAALEDRPAAHRALVQYVHQDAASSFLPDRPVLDQVARGGILLRGLPVAEADAEAAELLARLGLDPDAARRRPEGLSGGQLQRAAVARALLVRPAVLVADEMTSALDPEHRAELLELVDAERRARGTTVLAVSHDLATAAQMADRVLEIEAGRTVADRAATPVGEGSRRPG